MNNQVLFEQFERYTGKELLQHSNISELPKPLTSNENQIVARLGVKQEYQETSTCVYFTLGYPFEDCWCRIHKSSIKNTDPSRYDLDCEYCSENTCAPVTQCLQFELSKEDDLSIENSPSDSGVVYEKDSGRITTAMCKSCARDLLEVKEFILHNNQTQVFVWNV